MGDGSMWSRRRCLKTLAGGAVALPGLAWAEGARLVTVGGSITEIVFALGLGDQVVGADATSVYPASVEKLPRLGYYRQLTAEGLLSLKPSKIICRADAGPPGTLSKVERAGVPVVRVPVPRSREAAVTRIQQVADAAGRPMEGKALASTLEQALTRASAAAEGRAAARAGKPRALCLYARGRGTVLSAGTGTSGEVVIGLAGGVNVAKGEGYVPLTAEAAIAARPEAVILPRGGLKGLGGPEGVWKLPGLSLTPAAKAKRLVVVDDLVLLGLGPRMAEAVEAVTRGIYGAAG